MTRRLSGLERQFYQQNLVGSTNIVCSLSFDSPLDSTLLKNALTQLMALHPVLSYNIMADPWIRFTTPKESILPYAETPSDDWRGELEKDLNRQYPGPQIFLHHLIGKRSHVLLGLNHAVVDGLSSLNLARDLIDLYSGREISVLKHGSGVEDRFPKSFRGARGWWRAFKFIFVLAKMGPALQIGLLRPTQHTASLGFTFDQMHSLNAQAKSKGSNFFALFSAIVLKALHELYVPNQRAANLSLNTPVSLRPLCGVHSKEIGVFLAGHLGLYQIQEDHDPFLLAKECFEALKSGISEGRPLLLTRWARGSRKAKPPKVPLKVSTHRPTASISNLGRVEEFPPAIDARIIEVHAVSAQSMKDPFAFVLTTYGDHTYIDLQYSREKIRDEEAHAMLEAVRQKLAVLSRKTG